MNKIFINIKELCGILENQEKPLGGDEANSLKTIKNAYLEIVDGKIASYGKMDDLEVSAIQEIIDVKELVYLLHQLCLELPILLSHPFFR